MDKKLILAILTIVACLIIVIIIFIMWPFEEEEEEVEFDYQFMWNVTVDLSNVVRNAYEGDEIHKGRAFGTEGDYFTANLIRDHLINNCSFDSRDVKILPLGPIRSKPRWHYTSKVETIDYQLTVDHKDYPYDHDVPRNETFVFPSAWRPVNWNYAFNKVRIEPDNVLGNYPFGGIYTGYYYNISFTPINEYEIIIGNVTYIPIDETVPEDQEGRIFLIDEVKDVEYKLENITNASVILIYDPIHAYLAKLPTDPINYSYPILRVSKTVDNLTKILQLLEKGYMVVADNVLDIKTLTFTYNLSLGYWPAHEHMRIIKVPTPFEDPDDNIVDYLGRYYAKTIWYKLLNAIHPLRRCRGFILYDSYNETHIMCYTNREWLGFSLLAHNIIPFRVPALPTFSVNKSVGLFLENHSNEPDDTISGYINQRFTREKHVPHWEAGVNASNVIANISGKDTSKVVIISNRFDGWWGETPGDSGAGGAIVLAIAKYFKDNGIEPKYNLLFLWTTGEEYGFRGAYHYRDSHPDENFILWIGTDQLAFNQKNTTFAPLFKNEKHRQIVWEIANKTDYVGRTGYNFEPRPAGEPGGAEDVVWQERCDTICFVKDNNRTWYNWHKAGKDFTEGDVLKNIDRNDSNVTAELVLETVKYFTIEKEKEDFLVIIVLVTIVAVILIAIAVWKKILKSSSNR